jgi:outer membrane biosynthesis protein TonB
MEEKEMFEIQFIQFVSSLYSSCMFQLGKIMNPITGKVEKDLNGAKATIDMLRMLEAKTQGNLSEREKNALTDALSNMQMNYIDEVKKGQEKKQEPEPKKEPEPKTKEEKAKEEKKEQKKETKKSEEKKPTSGRNSKGRIIVP